jgi:precorrin-8X/cobalt-precorrin-8 methylmutase
MKQERIEMGNDLVGRYALDPSAIEARGLAIAEAHLRDRFSDPAERAVAARIVYACGDSTVARALHFAPGAVGAGVAGLRRGAPIVTDVRMVASGVSRSHGEALGCTIHCAIDDAGVADRARASGIPRAVEAMRTLAQQLQGGIAVIGNAPTAVLCLLDLFDAGIVHPALVIGMPVGFVAAAESKDELLRRALPSITIAGTRGGSGVAAAAVNALLRLAAPGAAPRDRSRTAVLFAGHGSRAAGAAEAMLAAADRVRRLAIYPIVEVGYLEMSQPDLPAALRRCVEQGATRVLVVPYFLHHGLHIRRDIPNVLRQEADRYPGLTVSMGRPIGLQADLANVMVAGAREAEELPDIREVPLEATPPRRDAASGLATSAGDGA